MTVDPKTLVDSRIQLHWASQLLGAAADAKLEKEEDDSQSNLGWDSISRRLEGRIDCAIDLQQFTLDHGERSLDLEGNTLEAARNWLSNSINLEINFREYEMPEHPVANGAEFAMDMCSLDAMADWFSLAYQVLEKYGEPRVWPHHFDLGFWSPGNIDGRSIGGGFSLGDQYYEQPYFYVNPYGIDRAAKLPQLPIGHWTGHWFGAVVTAEELGEDDTVDSNANDFVNSAVATITKLID